MIRIWSIHFILTHHKYNPNHDPPPFWSPVTTVDSSTNNNKIIIMYLLNNRPNSNHPNDLNIIDSDHNNNHDLLNWFVGNESLFSNSNTTSSSVGRGLHCGAPDDLYYNDISCQNRRFPVWNTMEGGDQTVNDLTRSLLYQNNT